MARCDLTDLLTDQRIIEGVTTIGVTVDRDWICERCFG